MPFAAALIFIVQILFAVHVIRTGRDRYWIFLILFIPLLGCAIYFVTQILPELGQSRTVKKAGNSLLKAIDPERELRRRKDELALSDNIDNRLKLADECLEANISEEAIALYESCLKGAYKTDPNIMLRLAQAHFQADQLEQTKTTLEALIASNPDFKSSDGHLLYTRSLEQLNQIEQAKQEYESLIRSFPGEEARVRYALLLHKEGQIEKATTLFDETLLRSKRSPAYYRKQQKHWIKIAKEHVA